MPSEELQGQVDHDGSVTDQWRVFVDEIEELHNDEPPENSTQRQLMYKQDKVSDLLREIRDGWSDERRGAPQEDSA